MAATHIRQGEHSFGSPTHGRTYTAYPRNGRADSNRRAQENQEEADRGQTHVPQEIQRRSPVRR